MLGNAVEISSISRQILGTLVLDWVPNHFDFGAQLAAGEIKLVCIPVLWCKVRKMENVVLRSGQLTSYLS